MMMTSKWSQGEKSWARIIWNSSGTDMNARRYRTMRVVQGSRVVELVSSER